MINRLKGYTEIALRYLIGTKYNEFMFNKQSKSYLTKALKNDEYPHRKWLISEISPKTNSALEVGSSTGANLRVLHNRNKNMVLVGLDSSKNAIDIGNNYHRQRKLSITLFQGTATSLCQFEDKSFDLVFADALLLYISDKDLDRVISEMVRVARKRIAILDLHDSSIARHKFTSDGYIRNWSAILNSMGFNCNAKVDFKEMPPFRKNTCWEKYGCLITITV